MPVWARVPFKPPDIFALYSTQPRGEVMANVSAILNMLPSLSYTFSVTPSLRLNSRRAQYSEPDGHERA